MLWMVVVVVALAAAAVVEAWGAAPAACRKRPAAVLSAVNVNVRVVMPVAISTTSSGRVSSSAAIKWGWTLRGQSRADQNRSGAMRVQLRIVKFM